MRRKVGDIAIELMEKENSEYIGYETYGMLDNIYSIARKEKIVRGFKPTSQLKEHPLNRQQVILNALDRDDRFEKFYIRCCVGNREGLVRMFELKEKKEKEK